MSRPVTAAILLQARMCLEDALRYAKLRKTFGQRLSAHQVIRCAAVLSFYNQIVKRGKPMVACAAMVRNPDSAILKIALTMSHLMMMMMMMMIKLQGERGLCQYATPPQKAFAHSCTAYVIDTI
eukprot:589989-Amphidinium_carterae.1